MRFRRNLPAKWARTVRSWSSCTLNRPLGNFSTTVPVTSMLSSLLILLPEQIIALVAARLAVSGLSVSGRPRRLSAVGAFSERPRLLRPRLLRTRRLALQGFLGALGKSEKELRSYSGLRLHPDPPAMPLHHQLE